MDEGIQIDEIVHDDFLYFSPIDVGAELVQVYHILREQHSV